MLLELTSLKPYRSYAVVHPGYLLHMSAVIVVHSYRLSSLKRPAHTVHSEGQVFELAKCPYPIRKLSITCERLRHRPSPYIVKVAYFCEFFFPPVELVRAEHVIRVEGSEGEHHPLFRFVLNKVRLFFVLPLLSHITVWVKKGAENCVPLSLEKLKNVESHV